MLAQSGGQLGSAAVAVLEGWSWRSGWTAAVCAV